MPTFTPGPSVLEGPAGGGPLFYRYKLPRGTSVVQRQDGSFYAVRYPSAAELDAAKAHWLGGYTYVIDWPTANAILALGDIYVDTYTDLYAGSTTTPLGVIGYIDSYADTYTDGYSQ